MLAALAASGQTPSAFARTNGFGPYRVSYWRAKLDDGRGSKARARHDGFVAIEVRHDEQARTDAAECRVEVTLSNGRVVAFAGSWDPAAIAPWLHALDGGP